MRSVDPSGSSGSSDSQPDGPDGPTRPPLKGRTDGLADNRLLWSESNKDDRASYLPNRHMSDERPTYTLTLKPLPDPTDPRGYRRLRSGLKMLLRKYGLRCTSVEPTGGEPPRLEGSFKPICGAPFARQRLSETNTVNDIWS